MSGGVLGRFESINRARLHRIREALRPEQVRFFDVLPLLFHVNRPGLPGYVSRATPAGIKRFAPGPEAMDAALHLFRSAIGAGEAADPRDLLGIYCLGSLGSIAHCPESDLDVWVCHEPGIEARRLAELNAKARVIEQWAKGLGLEVHFFLIDPERFRAGGHARLSAECSGNAQHYLLLDEFYRSSVVLAGLCPMWWRVPPAEEHRYAECVAGLEVPEMPGVDLGGLGEVPREEFAGAALWQLGKVIDAPYKSVLKLLLLEAYAGEYPRPDLLAMSYKAYIYGGLPMPRPSIRIGFCTAGSKSTSKGRPIRHDWRWPGAVCTLRRKRRNAISPRTWPGPGVGGSSRGSASNGAGRARTPRGSQSGIDGASIG
jgi:adenylate cyclase, class 1